jgi:hypothetical protein
MTDNLAIWNAVSKTNPDNTKAVNQRGGFTSICAQSQIMEATRQFGPIGQGWGYIAETPYFHDNLCFVSVTLWHGDRANKFGPLTGGAEWKDKNGRLDSDCAKKATTDAVTKLLSQLGFNADVFLGLFDDNKYVERMKREFAERDKTGLPTGPINDKTRDWLSTQIDATGTPVGEFCKFFEAASLKAITYEQMDAVQEWLRKNKRAA